MFIKGCKCAQMVPLFDLHMCVSFFSTLGHFVHTLCFMPSQIFVIPLLHSTKWTSCLSKAPNNEMKKPHCGLRAASQVLFWFRYQQRNSLWVYVYRYHIVVIFHHERISGDIYGNYNPYFLSCGQIGLGREKFFIVCAMKKRVNFVKIHCLDNRWWQAHVHFQAKKNH